MSNFRHWCLAVGGCLLAVALAANAALAEFVSDNNLLPAPTYHSTNSVSYGGTVTIDSFFDVFADFERVAPPPPGGGQTNSFFDVFTEFDMSVAGVLGPVHIRESPTKASMRLNGLPPGEPYVWRYQTEMLTMEINGTGKPGGLPPGVMIRESPTLQSTGQTKITDLQNGQFRIDSFFDVFTELSIDGGQIWMPGSNSLRLEGGGPQVTSAVPELSSCLVWLVGSVALGYFGHRRVKC